MKAVFLDRDGVINRKAPEGEYIATWAEMEFCPGVLPAALGLKEAGFKIIVVTNQRGIALQKVRPENLTDIHSRMKEIFASQGVELAGIYFCPHDTTENCSCRKPRPGLLLQAAADHGLDLSSSWMVGDAASDIAAGRAAGCQTARIFLSQSAEEQNVKADITARDLPDAVRQILATMRHR
jgi:D-glycero-D-manno-heptose 1,7-bisphosphate phosphatase